MTEESGSPPDSPTPGERRGSRWRKTVGIICLVFAVLSLLQAVLGPAALALGEGQMEQLVDKGAEPERVDEHLAAQTRFSYLSAGASALFGAVLLSGAILLLKRRRLASPILLVWAVLKLAVGGYLLVRHTALSRSLMEMLGSPFGNSARGETFEVIASVVVWASFGFGLLWMAALPVFLLIWLNRARIRGDMANW